MSICCCFLLTSFTQKGERLSFDDPILEAIRGRSVYISWPDIATFPSLEREREGERWERDRETETETEKKQTDRERAIRGRSVHISWPDIATFP